VSRPGCLLQYIPRYASLPEIGAVYFSPDAAPEQVADQVAGPLAAADNYADGAPTYGALIPGKECIPSA